MARKIAAAADHGLDAFIFDWHYYDPDAGRPPAAPGKEGPWEGSKYLHSALESGYLGAADNQRLKFAVMWCNHDCGSMIRGAVSPETFEHLTDYVMEERRTEVRAPWGCMVSAGRADMVLSSVA